MAVLVTGGTGFIGSHTCVELINNNYDIVIVDSLVNSYKKVIDKIIKITETKQEYELPKISFYQCDIRDEKELRNIFINQKKINKSISAVIHFAGLKSVFESFKKPILYWDNNVGGTLKLIKVMKEFNCKKFIFSSSATIYDASKGFLLNEKSSLAPSNPYGMTKLTIENFLKDLCYDTNYNWEIISLRYFNPIGAHPSGLIGETPFGLPNNIFPYLCRVASGQYEKLFIFGNDWPTKDGTGIRDYIHVVDLAQAHLQALKFLANKKPGIIQLNVGTSNGSSVLDLVKTFEEVNNCNINYEFSEKRQGDFAEVIADNKLLIKTLNWKPKLNLKNMCKDGWNWQQKNPNGYS